MLLSLYALPGVGFAQDALPDRPLDDGLVRRPEVHPTQPEVGAPIAASDAEAPPPPVKRTLTEPDLRRDPRLASLVLGELLRRRDWDAIERILRFYPQIEGHDPLMVFYMQGALDRQRGRPAQAILAYREMVARAPELHNVEFDLAAMLYEDKQYREAQAILDRLRRQDDLSAGLRGAVEHYLARVESQQRWRGGMKLGYTYNDNVNNASDGRILYLWGLPFRKREEDMPQAANGTAYDAQLRRDINLSGHHFLTFVTGLNGTHYEESPRWSESSASFRVGYRYQRARDWLAVQPRAGQQWLDRKPYRRQGGASVEYGRWLTPSWQIAASYAWMHKDYDSANLRLYEGDLHVGSATLVHALSPKTVLYGNLDLQRDVLKRPDESSRRYGLGLGLIREWNAAVSLRLDARYGQREFDDRNLWDLTKVRKDREFQAEAEVAVPRLRLGGVTPKLAYQYFRVDSNIQSLYSRTGQQLSLLLEKAF